ncbi:hypothetical protein [Fischerella sp. PCC 9605]|uniref:hypothetical protein n=1 Tax=Fischerella sp. PCC 9605 TaxID=1173024 RepID=UPI0012DDD442|nr:hypothetical protein [Fischerella sp. PCC 9605]
MSNGRENYQLSITNYQLPITLTGSPVAPCTEALRVLYEKPRCARLRQSPLKAKAKTGAGLTALRASTWGKPPLERAGSPITN